jgi:serine/threonine protein kinase
MATPSSQLPIEVFKETLGIGSFGKVCRARYGSLPCAAKLIHETLFDPENHKLAKREKEHRLPFKRFEQECEVFHHLRHPNVTQYLGMYQDPDTKFPVLLMELMDGNLTDFLEDSLQQIPFHIQIIFSHDIALALSFLHANKIIHRDLSSNNVLLISNVRAKVTDFGMATLGEHAALFSRISRTMCPGTDVYMPPEAVKEKPTYSEKIDCFSFGVLIVQILTKLFPDPGDRQEEMKPGHPGLPKGRKVMMTIPELERRENHISLIDPSHPLLAIARDCLQDSESERPSAQQICERVAALKDSGEYTKSNEEAQHKILQLNELIRLKDEALAAKEKEIDELKEENKGLSAKVGKLEGTVKKLHQDLEVRRWDENN